MRGHNGSGAISFESLEMRRLLSGNVAVALDTLTDTIVIKGDNKSNNIVFTADGDGYIVTGRDGTTVNGHASVHVLLTGVPFPPNLSVDMGNGDDVVEDRGDAWRNGVIATGNGNDTIILLGDEFDNSLTMDTGNGDDALTMGGENGSPGTLNINMGNGNDSVTLIGGVAIDGDVSFNGGNGRDVFTGLANLFALGTRTFTGFESVS